MENLLNCENTDTLIYTGKPEGVDEASIIKTELTESNRRKAGFQGIPNETYVIPSYFKDGDTWYKITGIGAYAFAWCAKLKSVTIPDSVTSIKNSAFYKCAKLTSVTIPDRLSLTVLQALERVHSVNAKI